MAKPKLELIYKNNRIKVEPNKILAEKINPPPAIRKGIQVDDTTVMKVRTANTPKPRGDTPERVLEVFKAFEGGEALKQFIHPLVASNEDELNELTLEELKKRAELRNVETPKGVKKPQLVELVGAEEKNQKVMDMTRFIMEAMREVPLEGYSRVYLDEEGDIVDSKLVKDFQVVGIAEDGTEQLKEFPYLKRTKEYVIGDDNMYPLIYEGNMLQAGDYLYELPAVDDVNRFALAEMYADMTDYTKANGEYLGEVMAVVQPVYLIGGTTQEYIAIITPKRIVEADGTEKFTMLMKLSQSNVAYTHAMDMPKPGETPKTIESKQEPLRTVGFAQLVQAMKVAQ